MMPKFEITKEKEKTQGHYKTAATKRLIILNRSLCEKNLILNISEFPVQKYANELIKCKMANSFF